MNLPFSTSRFQLVALLAMGLLTGGTPVWGMGCAMAQGHLIQAEAGQDPHACCQPSIQLTSCCGTSDCDCSAPQDQPLPAGQTRDRDSRHDDTQPTLWTIPAPAVESQSTLERRGSALPVPASGSPSLIALHIRLQI